MDKVLIESCDSYLSESLNTIIHESDDDSNKKSFLQKIKDFFKRIWDWIKNIFYKLIGKSTDKAKRLEEKLKDSKEPTDKRLKDIFNTYDKCIKDDGIDFLSKLANNMNTDDYGFWEQELEEIEEYQDYYDKKEPVLKEQIKSWNIKLNNSNDLKEAIKILDTTNARIKVLEKKTSDIINKLQKSEIEEIKFSGEVFKKAASYTINMYKNIVININTIMDNTL
jgi:hypothetical protein